MRILITAGPTQEPWDPVRFLSNRSSGKMGYALAAEARHRGHTAFLVSGPVALPPPRGVVLERVRTAAEMLRAVERRLPICHALIMAAAVADWRPAHVYRHKIKAKGRRLLLTLEPTADILATLHPQKGRRVFVGFAAETKALRAAALEKLRRKGLDLIVANDVSRPNSGFEVDTNQVTLLGHDGTERVLPLISKRAVARRILKWVEQHAKEPEHFPRLILGSPEADGRRRKRGDPRGTSRGGKCGMPEP